jgi:hypothetical protein
MKIIFIYKLIFKKKSKFINQFRKQLVFRLKQVNSRGKS